ncbi:MAG: RNA polymerase sigma factor [Bacteroidota bacterium]|nr:RNA polymerase sigma factor [Bacteroidota bacterium]MDP4233726.1 RNA polymerase sigma factor [Bacteroidota bacterium]MDP4242365.1 RNA polymerase sigma factor [Bacteroidota bacterium]MDP4288682.1 RNA polymerase sigma factor [Bacteroidota bacterium]
MGPETTVETTHEDFWELVDRERHSLWQLARGLARSYDEACDLMSDTWVAAYRSFPNLRDPSAFHAFVSTIAVRLHRRRRWRGRLFVPLSEAGEAPYELTSESAYDLAVLIAALNRLPLREREALVLFELSGLSLKEIQTIQGISLSGVKSRLARARRSIKTMLSDTPTELSEAVLSTGLLDATLRFQQS